MLLIAISSLPLASLAQILMFNKGRFEPVDVLCGLTLPKPIMSNGARMLLEFRGRNSGSGSRGIKAEYKFLESNYTVSDTFFVSCVERATKNGTVYKNRISTSRRIL